MRKSQIAHALEGLQGRINKIAEDYRKECEWRRYEENLSRKGYKVKDVKDVKKNK